MNPLASELGSATNNLGDRLGEASTKRQGQ